MLIVRQIVASIAEEAAGPSYSVPRLCTALAGFGTNVTLETVGEASACDVTDNVLRLVHVGERLPGLRKLRASRELNHSLTLAGPTTDIFHSHGLWLLPNVYPAWAARKSNAAFVLSPRGMLGPAALSFSRLKKEAFWRLFQKDAVASAACLHATSELEFDDIRAFGLSNPVGIIPNGIDLPTLVERVPVDGLRTVLSLGRIHPKKGLDRLVRAWGRIETSHPQWQLRIIGSDENGYAEALRRLAASEGLSRVTVEPPIYGPDKLAAYRDADLFVLATLNENFAMTVAEALAAGTPVISTKGAPWAGLQTHGCGWWVEHGVDRLEAALTAAMALPRSELKRMGARGRAWMAADFSWDAVARDMLAVYDWLARGAEPPPTVRTGPISI